MKSVKLSEASLTRLPSGLYSEPANGPDAAPAGLYIHSILA